MWLSDNHCRDMGSLLNSGTTGLVVCQLTHLAVMERVLVAALVTPSPPAGRRIVIVAGEREASGEFMCIRRGRRRS